jgi:GH24 family phage-related lysozyme (muramidase)
MSELKEAIVIIQKYEGFSEKAFPSDEEGAYCIGYGTQFYPDGSPVKKGQWCTKEKALEYLFDEVKTIKELLADLHLGIGGNTEEALVSFIHSIGWKPFLYGSVIDFINVDDWAGVADEMTRWIFDEHHGVIGGLIERRREEVELLLRDSGIAPWVPSGILLRAFSHYVAAPHQVKAIQHLENNVNPYALAEFANKFQEDTEAWD